ncbi:MAG: hypothetical protein RIG61_10420 [Deltaproteobacteria bacterium]
MNYFPGATFTFFTLLMAAIIAGSPSAQEQNADSIPYETAQAETIEEALEVEIVDIEPEAQRLYCAQLWSRLYERQKAEIIVTTRGEYDEVAIFSCPDCSLEEHFVKPFLESEYRGKTGLMRLSECGFHKAIFKGARGLQEIVVEVPRVFPDPNRIVCINDWSRRYEKDYPVVQISSRGEFNETIVFSCLYCASRKSFVAPFLLTVHEGKTAMERMKQCGFKEVVFTNPSGTREVVREVR